MLFGIKSRRELNDEIMELRLALHNARKRIDELKEMIPEEGDEDKLYYSHACAYCNHNRGSSSMTFCELAPHRCKHFE